MKVVNSILVIVAAWVMWGGAVQAQSLGFTSLSAVVDQKGITTIGSGVQNSSRVGTGIYVIEFTRDPTACTMVATVRGRKLGFASVRHPVAGLSPNRIKVFTFSQTGVATNLGFNVLVSCAS